MIEGNKGARSVAKLWRSVCGVTRFFIRPSRRQYARHD